MWEAEATEVVEEFGMAWVFFPFSSLVDRLLRKWAFLSVYAFEYRYGRHTILSEGFAFVFRWHEPLNKSNPLCVLPAREMKTLLVRALRMEPESWIFLVTCLLCCRVRWELACLRLAS